MAMACSEKLFVKAALCAPKHFEVAYKINPWMGGQVDKALAQKQWDALKTTLEKLSVQVKTIDQVPGLPDMVFCCNSGLVYGDKGDKINFMSGKPKYLTLYIPIHQLVQGLLKYRPTIEMTTEPRANRPLQKLMGLLNQ
uniref:Uncharacterized protein n=1 Tax=Romanomermis culicivorax TaxID=13658 RepID=A0A915JMZ1_ROMCU